MIRVIALILAIMVALPLKAQSSQDAAIRTTIQNQMDAFIASDVERAFSYASPNIKGLFGSPQRFGAMVQQGYPMVWRPSNVQFLELREISGNLWQKVLVTDAGGTLHVLDYQMIPGEEGWQINGVQLLEPPQVGA